MVLQVNGSHPNLGNISKYSETVTAGTSVFRNYRMVSSCSERNVQMKLGTRKKAVDARGRRGSRFCTLDSLFFSSLLCSSLFFTRLHNVVFRGSRFCTLDLPFFSALLCSAPIFSIVLCSGGAGAADSVRWVLFSALLLSSSRVYIVLFLGSVSELCCVQGLSQGCVVFRVCLKVVLCSGSVSGLCCVQDLNQGWVVLSVSLRVVLC